MEKKELSVNELIEVARRCAGDLTENACINCTFKGGDYDCTSMLLLALADRLEEENERWVPFDEAMPLEEDEYLVMIAGADKPTVLYFDTEEQAFYDERNGECVWYYVNYWAPLPEPPEKENTVPKKVVKRCATCAYEDRMAEEERCIACESHSLWDGRK